MPDKSFLFKRPPLWSDHETAAQRRLPAELQSWLNETGSLTKRLRGIYGNRFGVELLFHRWKPAFNDECRLLKLPPARYQLIREVVLHAGGRPLVLARTVLPDPTIKIAHRNLSHLGTRPLGEVIFAYPDLQRRHRQFSRAEPAQWATAVQARMPMEPSVWGRRTEYAIHGHSLLVAEFFLPALFERL
ncbi:chorismate--pyruvate lyase family protein [Methylomonas koyamae]|uniref:Probable chorismate pyruvate-lyase n=1 Tax=Methylomonas koyamae TaxID=702114 RepID=A0A291II36_9GAMM|nr:chorismate lyase [Methylomonas koyamae]ATG89964.1 chorismate--pyruvate lyase [Methylomonas koyamae]OAI25895.1 chorismate--pyruvate lyase [Methylomonas koyamae]